MLKLADNLELPLTAVTQPFGFIARRGGGKTHNAGVLVEQLLGVGAQVVVIDPVGTWYGLRLAADGKAPSPFPIYVLGGEHGDLPLEEDQGEQIARVVLETSVSVVLDISWLNETERKKFVTAFLKALFEGAKRKRSPRMVVIEEAQTFAPQRLLPGDSHMYHAVTQVVRLGRNFGLGCMLISQRPQSVNKEVLTQVECLCVGQLSAELDRKAIEGWVVENEVDKKWLKELASLPKGTMMVWSPQWLGEFKKVHFNRKTTFDASATPEFGKTLEIVELPKLDLASLQAALAKPADKAQGKRAANHTSAQFENSARVLLEEENGKLAGEVEQLRARVDELAQDRYANAEKRDALRELVRQAWELLKSDALQDSITSMKARESGSEAVILGAKKGEAIQGTPIPSFNTRQEMEAAGLGEFWPYSTDEAPPTRPLTVIPVTREVDPLPPKRDSKPEKTPKASVGISNRAHDMLAIVCGFSPVHLDRHQLALVLGLSSKSSGFRNYLSELVVAGMVDKSGALVLPTTKALHSAAWTKVANTLAGRVACVRTHLANREAEMLDLILQHHAGISRARCAAAIGLSVTSSGFRNYVSTLSSNGLIEKSPDGSVLKPSTWLLKGKRHA